MKLREKMKRFWTLDVHNHEGFTLVELIIVIAILAILSTGAIAGYSAYVERANKTSDQALVAEIKNVLTLYYYSHGITSSDYVILDAEGATTTASDDDNVLGFAEAALVEAYGENWSTALMLKYADWTNNAVLSKVLAMGADGAANVANSSFLTNSTPAQLVSTFSTVTDALAGMASTASTDPLTTVSNLAVLSDTQVADIRAELDELNLTWSTEADADNSEYSTALSNLMIKYVSDEVGNLDFEDQSTEPSILALMALQYGAVYAWASGGSEEGQEVFDSLNGTISGDDVTAEAVINAILGVDSSTGSDFAGYMEGSSYENDMSALITVMGTVSDLSDDFSMTTEGLYSSDSIQGMVNDYTNAVVAIAGLTAGQIAVLNGLTGGEIVIFITSAGAISVVPSEVLPVA